MLSSFLSAFCSSHLHVHLSLNMVPLTSYAVCSSVFASSCYDGLSDVFSDSDYYVYVSLSAKKILSTSSEVRPRTRIIPHISFRVKSLIPVILRQSVLSFMPISEAIRANVKPCSITLARNRFLLNTSCGLLSCVFVS